MHNIRNFLFPYFLLNSCLQILHHQFFVLFLNIFLWIGICDVYLFPSELGTCIMPTTGIGAPGSISSMTEEGIMDS